MISKYTYCNNIFAKRKVKFSSCTFDLRKWFKSRLRQATLQYIQQVPKIVLLGFSCYRAPETTNNNYYTMFYQRLSIYIPYLL